MAAQQAAGLTGVSSARSLLLRLGRVLRYRPLPALVGRRIGVESFDAFEAALRELVSPWLPPDAAWRRGARMEVALVKYGLVDTELAAPAALLDTPDTLRGIAALREAGYLPRRGERWDDELPGTDDDPYCLSTIVDDLGTCVLKLYLQDDRSDVARHWWVDEAKRTGVLPRLQADYFPRSFVVHSACVTNAPAIWFLTHFYL